MSALFMVLWFAENAEAPNIFVQVASGSSEMDSRKGRQAVLTKSISQELARDVRQNSLAVLLQRNFIVQGAPGGARII